jgi:hypothetical protein
MQFMGVVVAGVLRMLRKSMVMVIGGLKPGLAILSGANHHGTGQRHLPQQKGQQHNHEPHFLHQRLILPFNTTSS